MLIRIKMYLYVALLMVANPRLSLGYFIRGFFHLIAAGAGWVGDKLEEKLDAYAEKLGDKPRNLENFVVPKLDALQEKLDKRG